MSLILLDTNHACEFLKENDFRITRFAERLSADDRVSLPMPVLGELWYMVYKSSRIEENRRRLAELISLFEIVPFDMASAKEFGIVQMELRKKGRPIPKIDIQIAAIARASKLVLVTADVHFANVDGLVTQNWLV